MSKKFLTVQRHCTAWIKDGRKLVAKPDMLIKRRGKSGLLCLNKGWEESRRWIEERAGKLQKVVPNYFVILELR